MTYIGLKTCPKCEGAGQLEYEFPVADYGAPHGGFLDTEWGDCDQCGGRPWWSTSLARSRTCRHTAQPD